MGPLKKTFVHSCRFVWSLKKKKYSNHNHSCFLASIENVLDGLKKKIFTETAIRVCGLLNRNKVSRLKMKCAVRRQQFVDSNVLGEMSVEALHQHLTEKKIAREVGETAEPCHC